MSGVTDAIGQAFAALLGHPLVGLGARLVGVYLVLLWVVSAWWAWRDARARTRDPFVPYLAAAGIILVTPVLFPLAVMVYRVIRPPLTVAAAEAQDLQLAILEEEAVRPTCGRCGAVVDEEWVACPTCGSELAVRCAGCGRPLELDWTICAWCAADVPWATPPDRRPPAEPVAIPIRPGGRPLVPVMALSDEEVPEAGVEAGRRRSRTRRPADRKGSPAEEE